MREHGTRPDIDRMAGEAPAVAVHRRRRSIGSAYRSGAGGYVYARYGHIMISEVSTAI
jgi:hypothetical protein